MSTSPSSSFRELFQSALDEFVSQAREDRYVIAAIAAGSYVQDTLWEKSDTRQHFKRAYEAVPGANNLLSFLSNAKFLFCKDPALENYVNEMNVLGEEYKRGLLLYQGNLAAAHYVKCQKYLTARHDVYGCFLEVLRLADILAGIEVLLHDQIPQKDVMTDAKKWNFEFFDLLSTRLINETKTEKFLSDVLERSLQYIKLHEKQLFQPVFEIMSEISSTVSLSYLYEQISGICYIEKDLFTEAMEWLVSEGFVEKYAAPARITTKSKTMVNEAVYSYEGGE